MKPLSLLLLALPAISIHSGYYQPVFGPGIAFSGKTTTAPVNLSPPSADNAVLCRNYAPVAFAFTDTVAQPAPLFQNLGILRHPVSTRSAPAQDYFNQGLRLVYGFNHHEAYRSFVEAARLDPDCAMAYWGQALALAPNINLPIDKERSQQGYVAIQKAMNLRKKTSAAEKDYIEAMARRFAPEEGANRPQLDSIYAVAMGKLADKYPNDPDAGALYADALMNRRPWDYWTREGKPRPGIEKAVSQLERVIKRFPDHPGAHHLYIHVVEASNDPHRGVPSAERLAALMPGSGHLVHMPAHIYLRVGRYSEAIQTNLKAVEVDEAYITQCQVQGVYPMAYYPHNIHFIWAAAAMEGKSQLAIEMARKTASKVERAAMAEVAPLQGFYVLPMLAYLRFGKWNEILTEPYPGKAMHHANAMWHYTRGIAYTAKGQLDRAGQELRILDSLGRDTTYTTVYASQNPTSSLLVMAQKNLAAEMAVRKKNFPEAIRLLREGVLLEDELRYDEPRSWPQPMRHTL